MGFFSINKAAWEIKAHRFVAAGYEVMGGVAYLLTRLPSQTRTAVIKFFSGSFDALPLLGKFCPCMKNLSGNTAASSAFWLQVHICRYM